MMMRFSVKDRILAALVLAVVLLLPQPGIGAKSEAITPPYSNAMTGRGCDDGFGLSACVANPTADAATGAIALDLMVRSPADGGLPGFGHAVGVAWVEATHALTRPVAQITYTVTLHVNFAHVSHTGLLTAATKGIAGRFAVADAEVRAVHCRIPSSFCGESGVGASIVHLFSGPASRSDTDLKLQVTLRNESGLVPPGQISILASVLGEASLDDLETSWATLTAPDAGMVRTRVDAVVTSITVALA